MAITDALGGTEVRAYDLAGQLVYGRNALGQGGLIGYNLRGMVTQTSQACGCTPATYTYDSSDNLDTITDALGIITSNLYNALNQVTSTTRGYGTGVAQTVTTVYNAVNEVSSTIDPLGNITSKSYDCAGPRDGGDRGLWHLGSADHEPGLRRRGQPGLHHRLPGHGHHLSLRCARSRDQRDHGSRHGCGEDGEHDLRRRGQRGEQHRCDAGTSRPTCTTP